MKIVVLGATGPTGQQLVMQALARGFEVHALVRNPDKLASQVQHEKLQIHKADLTKAEELAPHMSGADAVLSCLGGQGGIFTACTVYTDTIGPIATAMRQAGVKRLLVLTAWGVKDEDGVPWMITYFLKQTFLRNVLANMLEMENYIEEKCKDLTYTVIKPPRLSNDPVTDKEIVAREGEYVPDVSGAVSRADVARFMLLCLHTDNYDNKMVAIAVPK